MSSDSNLDVMLVVGFGAGIFWFFKGFKVYREYRVLEDTPEVPIRSMAMGLVEIHGKASPLEEKTVPSPVSQTPCLFYKVDIERWQSNSKGGGSWQHYKTDANGVPFYLEDGTGRVLVDARGAEYDLLQSAKRETGGGSFVSVVRLFSGRSDPSLASGAGGGLMGDQALIAYAESLHSMGGGASVLAALGNVAFGSRGINLGGWSSGRYRFTEYCILPGHWYAVTGTCAENPNPKDEHDRNMIVKGTNEPTFLITWRNEKQIQAVLRRRAALHIFGGGALSIACLAFLLGKFGWLF